VNIAKYHRNIPFKSVVETSAIGFDVSLCLS